MRYLYMSLIWATALLPAHGQDKAKLSAEDIKEIRGEARKVIETHLSDLLNSISSNAIGDVGRRVILVNSFLPSESQIFIGPRAIIEDDVNPEFTVKKAGYPDLKVQAYLENLDLFYTESENPTITLSQINVSDVMQGASSLYVLVHFRSHFTNLHKNKPTVI